MLRFEVCSLVLTNRIKPSPARRRMVLMAIDVVLVLLLISFISFMSNALYDSIFVK